MIIGFGIRMIWKIMDISEDIIRRGTSALANYTVFDLYNSSYHTQYRSNNC